MRLSRGIWSLISGSRQILWSITMDVRFLSANASRGTASDLPSVRRSYTDPQNDTFPSRRWTHAYSRPYV